MEAALVMERVLHVHLRTPLDPQNSLCEALASLGVSYRQVDWLPRPGDAQREILELARTFQPTVVFAQLQGPVFPVELWDEVKQVAPEAQVVSWCGDIGRPLDWAVELSTHIDALLFTSFTQVTMLREQGVHNAGYLQIGYDTDWFFPRVAGSAPPSDGPDVLFFGQNYDDAVWAPEIPDHEANLRRELLQALQAESIRLDVYGSGWQNAGVKAYASRPPRETGELYRAAKLALSVSLTSKYVNYTSDRLFRAMACGTPTLVKRFEGCESPAFGLESWKNCFLFDTVEECVTLARILLQPEHADSRVEVGAKGAQLVRSRHTWQRRMEGLKSILVGLRRGDWP